MKEKELLTVPEFAKRAGKSATTIYYQISLGEIKSKRKKKRNRTTNYIPVSELEKFKR